MTLVRGTCGSLRRACSQICERSARRLLNRADSCRYARLDRRWNLELSAASWIDQQPCFGVGWEAVRGSRGRRSNEEHLGPETRKTAQWAASMSRRTGGEREDQSFSDADPP